MVKTKHKKTRKRHHHDVSSSEDSDDSDDDTPTHKSARVSSHHSCVQSCTAPAHRGGDEVSIPDEEEMNRNLKAFQWESNKDGTDDAVDDFKELPHKLNKEEELGQPV